jgi:hypothetical protein
MSKAKAKTIAKPAPRFVMVVYGFDEDKKPRAAKFSEPEFQLARKAAELMKLNVFEGDARKLHRALKKLPVGDVYASGWASIPNVRRNQFDALIAKLTSIKSETTDAVVDTGLPTSWDSIGIGHLVLGQADSADSGWWPCNVVEVDGDMLVLRAVQFPDVQVVRNRYAVAMFFTKDFIPPDREDGVAPGLPVSWAKLKPGDLVIAPDTQADKNGFWEAEIVEVVGDKLTLIWQDFPRQPKFKRPTTEVALVTVPR